MPVDDVSEPLLLGAAEGAQRQGHRQREPSAIEPRREFGSQAACDREPPLDPEGLSSEVLGDGGFGEPVLVAQGGDDAGFVHGTGGPRGGVGIQKPRLHPGGALDRLDDDRDLGAALRAPESQSLEAVENLEGVPGGGHAQRQRREVRAVRAFAAQRREGRPQPFDRDEDHRVSSGSGRIWKSG